MDCFTGCKCNIELIYPRTPSVRFFHCPRLFALNVSVDRERIVANAECNTVLAGEGLLARMLEGRFGTFICRGRVATRRINRTTTTLSTRTETTSDPSPWLVQYYIEGWRQRS